MKLNYHHAGWEPANGTIVVMTLASAVGQFWRRVEVTDPQGARITIELTDEEALDLYRKLRREIEASQRMAATPSRRTIHQLYAGFPPTGRRGVWAWAELQNGKHIPLDMTWSALVAKIDGGAADAER